MEMTRREANAFSLCLLLSSVQPGTRGATGEAVRPLSLGCCWLCAAAGAPELVHRPSQMAAGEDTQPDYLG